MGNDLLATRTSPRYRRRGEAVPNRLGGHGAGFVPRRLDGQDGYVLAMTALLMIPLMVFVSFAIDIGAWYGQASRMQRAADAASLAAVVWMPNTTKAQQTYIEVARANGFVTGGDVVVAGAPYGPNQYQVSITSNAERFFSGSFATGDQSISRSAIAEYNKAVPLGSPTSEMGNDVENCPQKQPSQAAPCGPQPMLWSAINGPYQAFAQGDPYSTKCPRNASNPDSTTNGSPSTCDSGTTSNGAVNDLYKPNGYSFAIDVSPADVGSTLTFQVYDPGVFQRTINTQFTTKQVRGSTSTSNNRLIRSGLSNFAASDVGKPVQGTGIAPGATITQYISNNEVRMSANGTSTGTNRTFTITTTNNPDCTTDLPPFDGPPYNGVLSSSQNCQTGDSGGAPFQVQLFQNDGVDLTVDYTTPISGCHLHVPNGSTNTLYKNQWVTVCSFTATLPGVYPVRVKSSNITLPGNTVKETDVGTGNNGYALRVTGSTNSRLYALDDLSIYTNTPSSDARFYLADIGPEHAGKRLQIDLYDAGDGSAGNYTMQVLAPPSGAPNAIPTSGATIPAAGIADSCRYNPTASATKDQNVAGASGAAATNCTVQTRSTSSTPSNKYNASWLRIEIEISDNYTCSTDCWWSIKYDFGGAAGIPTDRTVWSIRVLGDPVHLIE